jgi:CRISPR-associated protein Cas1
MRELSNTLFVTTPGTSLHLDGDAVRVVRADTPGRHLLPLARIDHVVAFGGVTISDELVCRLSLDGKTATWLTGAGRLRGRANGATPGNPHLRLAQYRAHDDATRRLELARRLVAGKLQNTRQLLLRAARDMPHDAARRTRRTADNVAQHLRDLPAAENLNQVLGHEGQAARDYVGRWPDLISATSSVPAPRQRVTRPATDPFNAALNFGYALLRIAVTGALESIGLDPYIGYLHGVRPGKPALSLDVMEEFRALLVDRVVLTAVNRRQLTAAHFQTFPTGIVEMTDDGRRTFLDAWSDARRREWPHPPLRSQVPAALLPLVQARLLARHLRGGIPTYVPWHPA